MTYISHIQRKCLSRHPHDTLSMSHTRNRTHDLRSASIFLLPQETKTKIITTGGKINQVIIFFCIRSSNRISNLMKREREKESEWISEWVRVEFNWKGRKTKMKVAPTFDGIPNKYLSYTCLDRYRCHASWESSWRESQDKPYGSFCRKLSFMRHRFFLKSRTTDTCLI